MGIRRESGSSTRRMGTPAFAASIFLAGVVVLTGAVFLGKSDNGQINVAATIQNSNQANTEANGGDTSGNTGAVPEAFRNVPNGGLVPQGDQSANTPTEPPVVNAPANETATVTPQAGDASTDTQTKENQNDGTPKTTE